MSNAIEHFSRTRVEDTTLQVIADTQRNLDRLIREEETVIRHFVRLGTWPHKSVNMFVFENLQPLVAQIKSAAVLCSVVADDIDRRPMVNIYDTVDPAECTVFVNRRALENEGMWNDAISLRALLAHEHSHPLAENATVRAARELSVEIAAEGRMPTRAIVEVLHLLADRLCVHSPQEVFANEIAIRAGFGAALFHLDRGVVAKARLGVGKRTSLVRGLEKRAKDGKLTAVQVTALLLVADLQAYLGFALETAPFLRAECRREAQALEAALIEDVLCHLDPAALRLYEKFRDHYLRLGTDLTPAEMKAWSGEALGFLADAIKERHLLLGFSLVRTPSAAKPRPRSRMERASAIQSSIEQERGSP